MIANWMCLFVYLKYEFGSTYLFLFVRITNLLSAYCVRGPFVQTSLYVSWKFWVGGNLNIINESRNHKKGWDQIFKVQWGKQKGQEHDFWLKVSGGKTLEETMIPFFVTCCRCFFAVSSKPIWLLCFVSLFCTTF